MTNKMTVVTVEKNRVLVRLLGMPEIWLPKTMLKQYGASPAMLKNLKPGDVLL